MTPGPIESQFMYYPIWTEIQTDLDLSMFPGSRVRILWEESWPLNNDFEWIEASPPMAISRFHQWQFPHAWSSVYAFEDPKPRTTLPWYESAQGIAEALIYVFGVSVMLVWIANKWRNR